MTDHDDRVSAIAERQGISYLEVQERAVMLMTELIKFQEEGGEIILTPKQGRISRLRIL